MKLIGVRNGIRSFNKLIIMTAILFITGCVFSGCSKNESESIKKNLEEEKNEENVVYDVVYDNVEEEEVVETIKKDEIRKMVDDMTLEEKIGQMFIVGFEGYELDENIKDLILNKQVGGIILFSKNISTVEQTRNIINELNELNNRNKAKLFISVDEEGGIVSRIPKDVGNFESAWSVGSTGDLDYAFEHGKAIGTALSNLGFNVDFAPVLDVNSNPSNPVIGVRAFSDDPYVVRDMATQVYNGLKAKGIIAVGKHFPGHGDTSIDSHEAVPVINKSIEELQQLELIPFEYAINQGIPMIMTSHLLLPQLDSEEVASLSPKIINDLLREKLNFKGVTITDDMVMGGVTENYTVEEGIVKAIEAGQDMVILSGEYENQLAAINVVIETVNSGRISEDSIDESVYRILSLKNEYLN